VRPLPSVLTVSLQREDVGLRCRLGDYAGLTCDDNLRTARAINRHRVIARYLQQIDDSRSHLGVALPTAVVTPEFTQL